MSGYLKERTEGKTLIKSLNENGIRYVEVPRPNTKKQSNIELIREKDGNCVYIYDTKNTKYAKNIKKNIKFVGFDTPTPKKRKPNSDSITPTTFTPITPAVPGTFMHSWNMYTGISNAQESISQPTDTLVEFKKPSLPQVQNTAGFVKESNLTNLFFTADNDITFFNNKSESALNKTQPLQPQTDPRIQKEWEEELEISDLFRLEK